MFYQTTFICYNIKVLPNINYAFNQSRISDKKTVMAISYRTHIMLKLIKFYDQQNVVP